MGQGLGFGLDKVTLSLIATQLGKKYGRSNYN